jgi:thiol-disulfide isomerase/thioredoxin
MLSDYGKAPEIIQGGEWFNSQPLTLQQLRGKVVLVDFWTYSCINCIRTLPYLKDWYAKYHDKGFEIIGVHSPEFEFEKKASNVSKAIADFEIKYPVMQDNDFKTWKAYSNQYWPAKYLIDKNGTIRYTHFGEGEYDKTEEIIQDLLKETGAEVTNEVNKNSYEVYAQSHESYLGYERIEYLESPEEITPDISQSFTAPASLSSNTFSFQGTWTVGSQKAMPDANALLRFNFSAKNVYLVMNPKNGITGKVKVYLDDVLIGDQGGKDVVDNIVTVDSDRLYELVNLKEPGRHILKLEFLDGNVEAFAFTFG